MKFRSFPFDTKFDAKKSIKGKMNRNFELGGFIKMKAEAKNKKIEVLIFISLVIIFFHRSIDNDFLWRYNEKGTQELKAWGPESWSGGYGRRFMFERSWARIPVPYTGWTWHFFTSICCKKLYCFFEKTENKWKRGRGWPI